MYTKRGNRNLKVAPSVYGGAGGHGTRISNFRHWANYGSGYLLFGNEKMAMQNLNDRLAIYLEKVRTLEQFNSKLELKIKQWYEKNTPSTGGDYSAYYRQINELKNQIKEAQQEKARCVLKIDNTKMTADDFRLKYENERGMCLAVEADIQGFSKVFDDLTLCKTDLELQIEHLNKELIILKKEHQEEVDSLRKQLGNTVNVQLKAVPGQSLSAIIDKMRQKYEALAQKNLQKAKEQFKIQTEALQQQVTVNATDLKESETQLKDLSHTYKNLSINLNSHLSMKDSLEQTLQDTKARYHRQLAAIQKLLNTLEAQMIQIRTDAERQSKEFDALLDIKTRLEQEIATYHRLLEGKDMSTTGYQISMLEDREIKKTMKIKTAIQEIVDGKVVTSKIKEMESV